MKRLSVLGALILGSCATAPPAVERRADASRPWAERVENAALPNLHRVAPELWRGAQPTPEGLHQLEHLGIRTVVSLRTFSRRDMTDGTGLELVEIPMQAWAPNDDDLIAFLRVATDPARQPVFVHCYHGADRTGLACAAYRIVVQGWSKDEALAEMTGGGFGFHPIWDELQQYVRELDVERVRARMR